MSNHTFSAAPQVSIQRSVFSRPVQRKMPVNASYLVPFWFDEVLPGDTIVADKLSFFGRLATMVVPVMDNLYLDYFVFFVPNRLVWKHWTNMHGERPYPDSSVDYTVPQVVAPEAGFGVGSLYDYFGVRPGVNALSISALPFRAYNLIYDEWFRDENLCTPTNMALEASYGDGPDTYTDYVLKKSGKRHDYFTSCLSSTQKGPAVMLPLGTSAPVSVYGNGKALGLIGNDPDKGYGLGSITAYTSPFLRGDTGAWNQSAGSSYTSGSDIANGTAVGVTTRADRSGLVGSADLTQATAALIETVRNAFQLQKLFERDARGGTRYTEMLLSHFGVSNPDARLQRPELLATGTTMVNVSTVAQTSATDSVTPQANLAAYATVSTTIDGFSKSFTEFGMLIGLVRLRTDLTYQQGTPRAFFKKTRFDFYYPEFAALSEQAVYNREIYTQGPTVTDSDGNIVDNKPFGFNEAWADYRYKPAEIVGILRSGVTNSLDVWHLAQAFASVPGLNQTFIEEDVPMSRIKAVSGDYSPDLFLDVYGRVKWTRPMPMYSVPGLVDHF